MLICGDLCPTCTQRGVKPSQPVIGQNNIVSFFDRQRQLSQQKAPSLPAPSPGAHKSTVHTGDAAHCTRTSPLRSDSLANRRGASAASPAGAPQVRIRERASECSGEVIGGWWDSELSRLVLDFSYGLGATRVLSS